MAVDKVFMSCGLGICVNTGMTEAGKAVLKTIHFSGVQSAVTDQELYDAGVALAGLQKHAMQSINRTESFHLVSK